MKSVKENRSWVPFLPVRTGNFVMRSREKLVADWRWFTAGLIFHDSIAMTLALQVAYIFRFQLSLRLFQLDVVPPEHLYENLAIVLVPIWLALFAIHGLYNRQNLSNGARETALIFNATATCILIVVVGEFLWAGIPIARGWLLVTWVMIFTFTSLGRYMLHRIMYRIRSKGMLVSPAVIVGANQEGRLLAEQLIHQEYSGLRLVGFLDDDVPVGKIIFHDIRVLGPISSAEEVLSAHNVEEIIVASSALDQNQIIQLFTKYGVSEDVNIRMSTGLYQIITTGLQVTELASVPLVKINKVRLTGIDRFLKGMIDYILAALLLLILLPVFAVIAVLVKLDSHGPVIYRRRVMGVNGQKFDAFKFRTMFVHGDEILASRPELKEELEKTQKLKDDPRITNFGAKLRKASLDELPQLLNVLKGQMSLIGPRMISPPEMDYYQQMGINLLTVKPGITGLWQVAGRSDVTYEERVRLDMYYIRNWSIWLDLQVLLRTIPAVLSHKGAY